MKTRNAYPAILVGLIAALLASAVSAVVPVVAVDGVFTVFGDSGEPIGTVSVDGSYESAYAMSMETGALPVPAGIGEATLSLCLSVADPAINEHTGEQWGVEFYRLNQTGEFVPIERSEDGRYRVRIDLSCVRPGLLRIPIYYKYRAGRSHSGFRLLGVKFTTDARTGSGAGASSICLYVVEPPQGVFRDGGQFDRDEVLAWARSLRNIAVGGDERVAVGGIYPLFTPRSANAPDQAQQAAIQAQIDQIRQQADESVRAATAQAGADAAAALKSRYDAQISDLAQKLAQAAGDAKANAEALAKANEALAEMQAQAEKWTAERQSRVSDAVPQRPSVAPCAPQTTEDVPPLQKPEAEERWTATYRGTDKGRVLIIRACVDNVRVQIDFGKGYDPVPDVVLNSGKWVQIPTLPNLHVTVSALVDGGRLVRNYGPRGPID